MSEDKENKKYYFRDEFQKLQAINTIEALIRNSDGSNMDFLQARLKEAREAEVKPDEQV